MMNKIWYHEELLIGDHPCHNPFAEFKDLTMDVLQESIGRPLSNEHDGIDQYPCKVHHHCCSWSIGVGANVQRTKSKRILANAGHVQSDLREKKLRGDDKSLTFHDNCVDWYVHWFAQIWHDSLYCRCPCMDWAHHRVLCCVLIFLSLFWKSKVMHTESTDCSCGRWCRRSTWFLKKQMLLMHNSFVHLSPVVWVYSQDLMVKKKALMNKCVITVSSYDDAILSMCWYTCTGKALCCILIGSWFLIPLVCHFTHGLFVPSCSPWKGLYPMFALLISPTFPWALGLCLLPTPFHQVAKRPIIIAQRWKLQRFESWNGMRSCM